MRTIYIKASEEAEFLAAVGSHSKWAQRMLESMSFFEGLNSQSLVQLPLRTEPNSTIREDHNRQESSPHDPKGCELLS